MDTKNRNLIIAGVVLLVVVVAGWWLFTGSSESDIDTGRDTDTEVVDTDTDADVDTGTSTDTGAERPTTAPSGQSLSVADQPAGTSVALASLSISEPSWVAVRDERSILGAGLFQAGMASGSVPLIRGTEAGNTYRVVIYQDNGDRAFDFKNDVLVEGVETSFVAQ